MSATHVVAVSGVDGSDGCLMKQIEGGSVGAFECLYDRYCTRAHRVAWSVCRDEGRAEEAVQEAFTAVWRYSSGYRPHRATAAAWLLTIVRNRAIDVARRHRIHDARRAGGELVDHAPAACDVAEEALARADAPGLFDALKRLPDAQQEVIALAFYGQLTHTEIATQLDLPPGTVKGRMRLGLKKLRSDIGAFV